MAVSPTPISPCLINGESGTGKELVAHALHRHSPRRSSKFIALNMAAIPNDLIESELFGHEKGAFTGAAQRREGRFEQANGGTLFLDEIGDMPPEAQTRLLRVWLTASFIESVATSRLRWMSELLPPPTKILKSWLRAIASGKISIIASMLFACICRNWPIAAKISPS